MDSVFLHAWYNETTLHPIGLLAVIVLGAAMMFVPRKYAIIPMLIMACFVAPAQRIVVFTLDFNLLRLMVLYGWTRVLARREMHGFQWKGLDAVIVLWALSNAMCYTLLHGSTTALINRLGFGFDALGMYFLFRMLVRDWCDVETLARGVVLVAVPVAGAFLIEKSTGRNMFAVFGGVPAETEVRDGVLRCQGAFAHPILAGSFWASLLPLMWILWRYGVRGRSYAVLGSLCAGIIIVTCASSTPVLAAGLAVMGMAFYVARRWMSWIRIFAVFAVVMLHLVMIQPVWHLLARINLVSGSTGWYRFKLIDDFIHHFDEWWLAGTTSIDHWWEWGINDVTNQYVAEGVSGGLLTLLLFLGILVFGFRAVGRLLVQADHHPERRKHLWIAWALGMAIFVHAATFIAVSYFGQIIMLWYLALAMVGSLAPAAGRLSLPALRFRVAPVSSSPVLPLRRMPAPRMVLARVVAPPPSAVGDREEIRRLHERLGSLERVIERVAIALEEQNKINFKNNDESKRTASDSESSSGPSSQDQSPFRR